MSDWSLEVPDQAFDGVEGTAQVGAEDMRESKKVRCLDSLRTTRNHDRLQAGECFIQAFAEGEER